MAVRFGAPKLHDYFMIQDELIAQADRDLKSKFLIVAAKPGHRLRYEIGTDRIEVLACSAPSSTP